MITHLPSYSARTGVYWQASGLDPEVVDKVVTVCMESDRIDEDEEIAILEAFVS